ncbi:class I adenylate-forming enzyme family protein [Paraburkholderia sp. J76]|uniref:class I adenylate-forming enzyme family protein n=1 Tax=Paraburkholderia sp. J76 TaxID=2805439 RepID=UPI002ABE8DE6|nr:class I adenylate-forming enzyme family protein [Paraburkholderia sp. J76]
MILASQEKIEAYTARGWWGNQTLWEIFCQNVSRHPSREAVVDAPNRLDFTDGTPRRLTYADLADEADRHTSVLQAIGLRKDDVIVVQLPNGVEQFALYLACARLGIIVSPVPIQYREHELTYILGHVEARAIATSVRIGKHAHAEMMLKLKQSIPTVSHVLAYGDAVPYGACDMHSLLALPAYLQRMEATVCANDIFTICWTSGTEARPKGVPRSHNEWLVVAPNIIAAAQLKPGCRLLNPFPFVNMAGISTNFAGWALLGATVVQHQPFSLAIFLQQVRTERIQYTVAAPAVLNMLLQDTQLLDGIDFTTLCTLGSGSAPLSEWMVRSFHEKYGVQIVNYFGSNEGAALTGSAFDIPDPELRAKFFPRPGVSGYASSIPVPTKVETRLVDIDSETLITEPGVVGELRFRGPAIFSQYWRDPERTERAFDADGFYRSGDLFEIAGDSGQFYKYVGRAKDLVIRGGMNISPEEIESLIQSHPAVVEVAVVGYPDKTLGERVCAFVALREHATLTLPDLVDYLRTTHRIASFKLPERLLIVNALPRNPVGKILKRDLRSQLPAEAA